MPRRATPLTAVRIKNARAAEFPLYDGHGLYLIHTPSGTRHWRLKYTRPDGRENRMALGRPQEVGLAEARAARDLARGLLQQGIDPVEHKRAHRLEARRISEANFETAAAAWLTRKKPTWAPETYRKAKYVIDTYLTPKLRKTSVATLTSPEANEAVEFVTTAAPALGRKARQYLAGIIEDAIHSGLREDGRTLVFRALPRQTGVKGHIPAATTLKDVQTVVGVIRDYPNPVVRAALKLAMYTAMRPGVVASARWDEIDLTTAEWHVPAERMKTRHAHIVPLPRQAIDALRLMRPLSGHHEFVFPAQARQKTPHLHRDTLSAALRSQGLGGTHATHGFRGMLRTVARERLGIDPDILEAQLAHAKKGEVNQAYDRTTFGEARREAMQRWADFLDAQE